MFRLVVLACLAGADPHAGVHSEHEALFGGGVPLLSRTSFATARQSEPPRSFERVVFGYLPYWSNAADVPWEHLTHLAYFSVEVNSDGTLGLDHGWAANGAALTAAGESRGVQVVLVATLFVSSSIGTLLGSAAARSVLVDNLVAHVGAAGGHGVNVDFEQVPPAHKANFVAFISELATAFHAAIPGSHVSVASPAIDWTGAYDYDQLALASDALLIMAYDYHWSGSDPGPVAPIDSGTLWSAPDVRATLDEYFLWGGAANRARMVLGVPLYGRDWPTTGTALPGTRAGSGLSVLYDSCQAQFAAGKSWEAISETPYRAYDDAGQPHQLFCEDEASLAAKLDLVLEYDLGGVMFWALGYAPPTDSLWLASDARFVRVDPPANRAPVAQASAPASAAPGDSIELDGSASSDPDQDALTFQWSALEGPPVSIAGSTAARATVQIPEAGSYRFELRVSDGQLEARTEVAVLAVDVPAEPPPAPLPARGCEEGCNAAGAPLASALALCLTRHRRRRR